MPEDAAGKSHVGRFSEGMETLPEEAAGNPHVGDFGEGVGENLPSPRPSSPA